MSSYRFFESDVTAKRFHESVVNFMAWWEQCLAIFPRRRCMYGTRFSNGASNVSDIHEVPNFGNNAAVHIRPSMYVLYVQHVLEVFPRKNVLIINSDEFHKDQVSFLQNVVYPFLKLETISKPALKRLNNTMRIPRINKTLRNKFKPMNKTLQLLSHFFKPFNEQLVNVTKDDSFNW